MSFTKKALILSWKHFVAFALLAALIIYFSQLVGIHIPPELRGALLTGKFTVTSVIIATMTFYYRTFWDSIDSIEKHKGSVNYSDAVKYHSAGFILLFGGGLFTFLSLGVELSTSLLSKTLSFPHVQMGFFFTGIILLFVFLIVFLGRTLGEMQTLREAVTK